ncbi:hypothetical protein DevBK_13455 [Devosia sp. BK]|uniref:COG4223 family protein n=1 Tax=Devosia sp. BK TaxID=2871706 RepID=UPI00293A7992|nr:hypothetical protein [Devosia sp. BK]MDV3252340.1 hypothetical protein [Devosia sp. BK]
MADPKDKASAPPETKPAGNKSAAVKPPVLEGKARPAGATPATPEVKPGPEKVDAAKPEALKPEPATVEPGKPESAKPFGPEKKPDPLTSGAATGAAKSDLPKSDAKHTPPPVAPKPQNTSSGGSVWLAGLVGGVIGLGAAYGLAVAGYWPAPATPQPEQDPRIAQVSSALPELQTVTSTLQDELARLNERVSSVESGAGTQAAESTGPGTDQLATDLAALTARVESLSSTPQAQPQEAAENAAAIASLQVDLATLRQNAAQTRSELDTVSGKIGTLESDVSAGTAAEAGQARLPLIVSGFDSAFATGSAFDAEVAALRQALPNFDVPQTILANAMTGLKRPDLVKRDFDAVLPDILAGRPTPANAGWQESAGDWFRGIIALRPTEAVDGEGPEATVARLEGAINRGDFIAAKTEFDALPETMRAAAGSVGDDIANQAAAQDFIADLRQAALTGGNGA